MLPAMKLQSPASSLTTDMRRPATAGHALGLAGQLARLGNSASSRQMVS